MKKFKCTYVAKNGDFVSDTEKQFEAADKESAALFFAQNMRSAQKTSAPKIPKGFLPSKASDLYRHQLDLYLSYGARSCADR